MDCIRVHILVMIFYYSFVKMPFLGETGQSVQEISLYFFFKYKYLRISSSLNKNSNEKKDRMDILELKTKTFTLCITFTTSLSPTCSFGSCCPSSGPLLACVITPNSSLLPVSPLLVSCCTLPSGARHSPVTLFVPVLLKAPEMLVSYRRVPAP